MLDDRHTDAQLDACERSDVVTLRSSLQGCNAEIAGHRNKLLGASNVSHKFVASQPREAVPSAGPRVQPGTQFLGPHVFLQTSRRHSVSTCHFFSPLLFMRAPSWLHAVRG